jgi:signal transduction histidine kinase
MVGLKSSGSVTGGGARLGNPGLAMRSFPGARSVRPEALAIFIGVLVLVGWLLDVGTFRSIVPGWPSMKPNAATATLLAGVAVWLLRPAPQRTDRVLLGRSFAVGVALIGVLTLSEYVFGWDLGIDQLLFREEVGAIGTSHPARMGANATVILTLDGLALLLLDVERRRIRPAEVLVLFTATFAMVSLAGYLYGAFALTGLGTGTRISLNATIAYLAISAAVLAARPRTGLMGLVTSSGAGGQMLRRLVAPAIGIPLAIGWLADVGEKIGLYAPEQTLAFFVVGVTIFFLPLLGLTARSLDRTDAERRAAEEQVRALANELEQSVDRLSASNADLDAFSYSVSHDLRAPLRAIDGFSRILLDEHTADLAPEGQRYLGLVRKSAHEMGALIDGLLAFSRLGQQELSKRRVKVDALAREIVAELQGEIDGRNVMMSIGNLPPADADPTLLKQVLVNLMSNAIKYTRNREPAQIDVASIEKSDPSVYYVRDNGVGFDMRYADKLFRVFQRFHRAEDYEGSGIGLALVARIVQRHGGRIWAEAKPDEGATFYFTLEGGGP